MFVLNINTASIPLGLLRVVNFVSMIIAIDFHLRLAFILFIITLAYLVLLKIIA